MVWLKKYDKLWHLLLCMGVTVAAEAIFKNGLGWTYGVLAGIVIECTQAERNLKALEEFFNRLMSEDTILDLFFDAVGVGIALWINGRIF